MDRRSRIIQVIVDRMPGCLAVPMLELVSGHRPLGMAGGGRRGRRSLDSIGGGQRLVLTDVSMFDGGYWIVYVVITSEYIKVLYLS